MNSADEIIQDLIKTRLPCKELSRLPAPEEPGFYAFFMRGGEVGTLEVVSKDGSAYVEEEVTERRWQACAMIHRCDQCTLRGMCGHLITYIQIQEMHPQW